MKADAARSCTGDVQHVNSCVSSALAHCHHLGIAHRDVKLENVVLRGKCVTDGVMLIDFGLAENSDSPSRALHAGTTRYRAPANANGHVVCQKAGDVWSLGILLFALCHGYMPFEEACSRDERFETFRMRQRAGLKACNAIYETVPKIAFRPQLCEKSLQLLDGMLQIEEASRLSAAACARWSL